MLLLYPAYNSGIKYCYILHNSSIKHPQCYCYIQQHTDIKNCYILHSNQHKANCYCYILHNTCIKYQLCYCYTVRPNSVAGEAGHVRLERPIDSSSDKTVCAPKVAEKGPYKGGTLGFINKPLTDPDFCSCRQVIRSALFPGNLGNSWEFLAFFIQNLQIISHNSCH